jgi:putative flippase GtrA
MPTSTEPPRPAPAHVRLGSLIARLYHRFGEIIRFIGVGGTAYIIDITMFNVFLLGFDWPWLAAKTASTVIATTCAFLGNRHWTWRHSRNGSARRQYILYFFFNGVGLLIALTCMWINDGLALIWPEIFGNALALNIAGNFVGVGLASIFRFYAYKNWVFKAGKA